MAVVAAYRPGPALRENIAGIARQVSRVVVVDDGSPAGSEELFAELRAEGVTVVTQPSNKGIAAALNTGIVHVRDESEPDYFLTFDQDSLPGPGYVAAAVDTCRRAQLAGLRVGFISASSYSGHPIPVRGVEAGFVRAFDPMQSGFLIPRATLDEVGLFDEGLFIDGVDSEYTMRTRSAGLEVLVGDGCEIQHDLGQREPAVLLGRPVRIMGRDISYNYHSPGRVYYICRNGTALSLRYVRKDPQWVFRRLIEEAKAHTLRLAFSRGRGKLVRAAVSGFRDAVRGGTGPIPPALDEKLNR